MFVLVFLQQLTLTHWTWVMHICISKLWTFGKKLQWNFNQNWYIFIEENAFENAVCEMAAMLSQPQYVNSLWPSDAIWRQRSQSTLAKVMACCYGTKPLPEPMLTVRLSVKSSDIHIRAISQFSQKTVWKLHVWNLFKFPRGQWVKLQLSDLVQMEPTTLLINILRLWKYGCHCPDNIFKCIFWN